MLTRTKQRTIEIVDDDDSDAVQHRRQDKKRKVKAEPLEEKVQWTDDSDDRSTRPKKRKPVRRDKPCKRTRDGNRNGDDLDSAAIPDYLKQRRRKFNANKRRQHEAALRLPPDYSRLDFGAPVGSGQVRKRPHFDAASGVKPSRANRDLHLTRSGGIIPASIAQYLRDYQVVGVKFLHEKFVNQQGGILGDDMGLGKTVQVAAFLAAAFGKTGDEGDARRMREMRFSGDRWYPRILIICPGSIMMNWRNELDRWGWWHVDVFHGANKEDVLGTARSGLLEIMITTYDTYKNCRSAVNMVQWDAVIADECHRLKDRSSETTKAMAEVNALCRIGLTGTAIQNRYEELWTLLDWTNPGHFGTRAEWNRSISRPLSVGQSHDANLAQLKLARLTAQKLAQNLLPRFFLRRMKTLIAHQLPKKMDRVVFCPLTDIQRQAYQNFVNSPNASLLRTLSDKCEHGNRKGWCCHKRTADGTRWQKIVFPSMMVLQKLANHLTLLVPTTTDLDAKHNSELQTLKTCVPEHWDYLYKHRDQLRNLIDAEFCGKWKVMRKLLKFWHANGDKVLVFSHSIRLLRILQHLMANTSYTVSYLDGSLGYEERQAVVDDFNADPTRFVFLISTKAGGTGLNITSANKVVVVDPHWNPAYDLQAQDRAYRIGQTRDVEVFRLISTGTVEEIVYARQIYKQQQANIGYTASSERRYFKGVQQDNDRKGEIFGLSNIFTYHSESGLLRDIVNKTNVAEAKAGVRLAEVNMEQMAQDDDLIGAMGQEDRADKGKKKKEDGIDYDDDDGGGLSRIAASLIADDKESPSSLRKKAPAKTDAVQAILASVGVEYTHHNAEVIGTSRVEEQLSRRATMDDSDDVDRHGQDAVFADSQDDGWAVDEHPQQEQQQHHGGIAAAPLYSVYRPPEDVCLRHFCEMAHDFGASPTDFALLVESWTTETRRNYLDGFYQRREAAARRTSGDGAGSERQGSGEDEAGSEGVVEDGGGEKVMEETKVKVEAVETRSIKAEPGEIQRIKVEAVETRSIKAEPGDIQRIKVEAVETRSIKAEPGEIQRIKAEAVEAGSIKVEPGKTRSTKVEPPDETCETMVIKKESDSTADKTRQGKKVFIFLEDEDDEL